jgi:hypothetical protein
MTTNYQCNSCNKSYSCRQSLYVHNKKFHVANMPTFSTISSQKHTQKCENLICEFCNKIYSRIDSLVRHQITCKNKIKHTNESKILENKYKIEYQKEIEILKTTISNEIEKRINLEMEYLNEIKVLEVELLNEIGKKIDLKHEIIQLLN